MHIDCAFVRNRRRPPANRSDGGGGGMGMKRRPSCESDGCRCWCITPHMLPMAICAERCELFARARHALFCTAANSRAQPLLLLPPPPTPPPLRVVRVCVLSMTPHHSTPLPPPRTPEHRIAAQPAEQPDCSSCCCCCFSELTGAGAGDFGENVPIVIVCSSSISSRPAPLRVN